MISAFERGRHKAEDDLFLWQECLNYLERGTADPPLPRCKMDAKWGRGRWLPLPRFQILQASGKKRPIDDGSKNEHNDMVRYSGTLDCPTPTHPVIQLRALVSLEVGYGPAWQELRVPGPEGPRPLEAETGTEDMPDAYRFVPIKPSELAQNVVAVWDPATGEPRYQEIFGHVFGKSAAVINFHRLQRLLTSVLRRWLALLVAFLL
jgi:hypothetical protein